MKRAFVVLSVLAALAALGLFATRVAERGRYAAPYSTLGGGPEGALGALRLAQKLGYDARAHVRELSHLRGPGTLIALARCGGELSRELTRPEREALLRWVEAGGLLVVAGVPDYLPTEAGLEGELPPTCTAPEDGESDSASDEEESGDDALPGDELERVPFTITAHPAGPPLTHMVPFDVTRASTVSATSETEATVLLESAAGPLGMTVALGRGRVVYLGTADAFTNENLWSGGGPVLGRLLRAFAPRGPVLFDEYHLGVGERRSLLRYLRDLGYGPALAQLALLALTLLVARGVRLGDVREPRPARPRTTRSYLAALGALYAHTRDRPGALDVLVQRALARVARHYRAGQVPLGELARTLHGRGLGAVAGLVERIEAHARTPLSAGETLEMRAQRVDDDTLAAIALGDAP